MKNLSLLVLALLLTITVRAQDAPDTSLPEFQFNEKAIAGEMHFLASDFLAGRRTGSVGNNIAAEYIASQLRGFGYAPLNGESFFQTVPLATTAASTEGQFTVGETTYQQGEELLITKGGALVEDAKVIFANYGWVDAETDHDDYKDLDVKGKIVVTRMGIPGDQSQQGTFRGIREKAQMAADRGAIAVIEIYTLPFPWDRFKAFFGRERMGLDTDSGADIPYGMIKAEDGLVAEIQKKKKGVKGSISTPGIVKQTMTSRNVGGVLRGTDPELRDEYIIMTAHFDHVGVGAQGGGAYTAEDSIFNGARDNAFGTISLLRAARAFAEVPTRRSIIILAVTGEEMGLLGSQYYAENPLIPLNQVVFNFNTDGAGYNATDAVSLIGANRTGIDPQVEEAAAAFGMTVIKDPAPEQGLYDRSDNVSFSAKGVPSLSFSPGMTDFNEEVMRFYHQVGDNPETIDMEYLKKYCQAFTLAARNIANRDVKPYWKEGDKYREAGDALYNKK